ncbi:hypothetical protein Alsa2_CDS0211 [Staphylococcus phage Alsa_2]|nr:hypothetical protein Alsa2_CDS0211 [Staphylococcus phage Alsa_2]
MCVVNYINLPRSVSLSITHVMIWNIKCDWVTFYSMVL